jgi:adiponectin receptor
MFLSAFYHAFRPASKRGFVILTSLDVAGICILNFGSVVSGNFYYNYCDPISENIYFYLSLVFSVLGFVSVILKNVYNKKFLFSQETTLTIMVGVNFLSMIHIIIMGFLASETNDLMPFNLSLFLIFLSGIFFFIAISFFLSSFPEKYFPRIFDIWLNSHTIWHIFVFVGFLTFYFSLQVMYNTRLYKPCLK